MNYTDFAIELAKDVGRIQMEGFGHVHNVEYKGVTDIVTEVDKKCELLIADRIQTKFPKHDILAEEGSGKRYDSDHRWIIDPLDGTVNYAHAYPLFAVSIALEKDGDVILGVVFEPNRNELYVAEKNGGATCNGKKIEVSKETSLRKSLLDTGFAYNVNEGEKNNNLNHFGNFLLKARGIRRDGVAAVDLCYVARGRFEGFWELYLKPWDIAAGALIVREAGGKVTSFNGGKFDVYGTEILASNGFIHEQMMEVLGGL